MTAPRWAPAAVLLGLFLLASAAAAQEDEDESIPRLPSAASEEGAPPAAPEQEHYLRLLSRIGCDEGEQTVLCPHGSKPCAEMRTSPEYYFIKSLKGTDFFCRGPGLHKTEKALRLREAEAVHRRALALEGPGAGAASGPAAEAEEEVEKLTGPAAVQAAWGALGLVLIGAWLAGRLDRRPKKKR